jgi:hypothetical protein
MCVNGNLEAGRVMFSSKRSRLLFVTVISLVMISGLVSAQGEIIDLEFGQPPVSGSDTSRTLQSLVKIQGTHLFCQDGLYLMTHFGDREGIFQEQNQKFIDNPYVSDTWRHCSVFSTTGEDAVLMGRNWDNQTVGSIIVSLYHPPEGYSSISFCRSIDLGFGHKDLEDYKSSIFGTRLLLAPFFATDGINEHGLTVAVAGLRQVTHEPESDKELVFLTFLIRKILDQAKNVHEAVGLVENYIPFDYDKNSLHGHFIIADSSGRSVILEYDKNQWRRIHGDMPWQVLTTKPIYNVSDAELRGKCWRYRTISQTLDRTNGDLDWKAGMRTLQDVAQKGTAWSVVYSPPTRELYLSVYQDWDTVYHLRMP